MLWKSNLELNTNVRADAKHDWKENIAKNIRPNIWGVDAGVQDGIMKSKAYTRGGGPKIAGIIFFNGLLGFILLQL